MVARSREREHGVKCSNEVAMIECRYWYRHRYRYKYRPTPRSLHSRIVSRHCRCVRCILVIAKGSGIVSRGQERRYSRARSLDGILDADRLMQRENAKLVIDAASSTRSRVFFLLLFPPFSISFTLSLLRRSEDSARLAAERKGTLTLHPFHRDFTSEE